MTWTRRLFNRWKQWRRNVEEPFDMDFPDSAPPIPDGFDCPDTQPTSPGALDTLPGRLEL